MVFGWLHEATLVPFSSVLQLAKLSTEKYSTEPVILDGKQEKKSSPACETTLGSFQKNKKPTQPHGVFFL